MFHYSKATFAAQPRFDIQDWDFQEDSNFYSMTDYINRLFERRSRLLVVRLDLGFRVGAAGQYLAEHARECFAKFMNNKRRNSIFKNEMGYLWALEWAPERGFHYHCLFFFDGHESQQDVTIGHRIGQYWRDGITEGNGYYHCCNDDKQRLEKHGYPVGIGMIHRDDLAMRENLMWMATYLIKETGPDEPLLRAVLPESMRRFRTFGHGEMR